MADSDDTPAQKARRAVDRRSALKLASIAALAPNTAAMSARPISTETVTGMRDRSVKLFGARGDGIESDSRAIQSAIEQCRFLQIPEGTYLVDQPLELRADTIIEFLGDARVVPAHDGMTVFKSTGLTPRTRVINPRIIAGERKGITAFDLASFRNGCVIDHPVIEGCDRGIVLRSLCWDLVIMQPTIVRSRHAIVIADRSNAIDIFHPALDGYEVGITIDGMRGDVTSTRIWGGYIQNGLIGIADRSAFGTLVYGTYFEGNREADLDLKASLYTVLDATQHFEKTGKTAIRGKNTRAIAIRNPIMASGGRQLGLLDVDASNSAGYLQIARQSDIALNYPLGNRDGLGEVAVETTGRFRPQLVGSSGDGIAEYTIADGRWRLSGTQATIDIDIAWAGHSGRGNAVLTGAPHQVQPFSFSPRPRTNVMAEGIPIAGNSLIAQMNGEGTNISLVTIDERGTATLMPIARSGRLSLHLNYSVSP